MRSHVEFRSSALLGADGDAEGRRGETVARLLATRLPAYGYAIDSIGAEDWGWRVTVRNADFPLWIGCGHYEEYPDGLLCFIEPSRPVIRRWFKRIPTSEIVERLASSMERVFHASGQVSGLRWWSGDEVAR